MIPPSRCETSLPEQGCRVKSEIFAGCLVVWRGLVGWEGGWGSNKWGRKAKSEKRESGKAGNEEEERGSDQRCSEAGAEKAKSEKRESGK
jgi:hypothetical protein